MHGIVAEIYTSARELFVRSPLHSKTPFRPPTPCYNCMPERRKKNTQAVKNTPHINKGKEPL
jgi:hypothetical protein